MKKRVAVVDGMGGGIGVQLIGKLRELCGAEVEIIALGANAVAAERMIKAGADGGASGENAVKVSVRGADIILGPIGIIISNSMLGEISPVIAEAVLGAAGARILIPLANEHFTLAGFEPPALSKMIESAVQIVKEKLAEK
jgi:hypothetical protein